MAGDEENPIDDELDQLLKDIRSEFDSVVIKYYDVIDDYLGDIDLQEQWCSSVEHVGWLSRKIDDLYEKLPIIKDIPVYSDNEGHYEYYLNEIRPCIIDFAWATYYRDPEEEEGDSINHYYDSMKKCVRELVHEFIESKAPDRESEEEYSPAYKQLDYLANIVSGKYFQPDSWQRNLADIKPVPMSKSPDQLPMHVRKRLGEVFRSYVYGNWLACIATSRALMEYCIIDRKHILGVEVFEGDTKKARRLHDIIESISPAEYPVEDMKKVQEYGNEAMHPVKSKKVKSIVFHKPQALDCIQSLSRVLSALYKTNKPFEKITG